MNNLALLYDAQGRYEDAELLYNYSLEIKEQVLGKDHSSVATTLNNLALLYDSQGRYVEAEQLYKRCLAILQEKLATGHEHIKTLELNYLLMQLEMAGTAHPRHES